MEIKKEIIDDVKVISDDQLELLHEFIVAKDTDNINNFCKTHNLIALANQINYFSDEEFIYMLKVIETELCAEIIIYLEIHMVEILVQALTKSEIRNIFEEISKDDIVYILSDISNDEKNIIINNLSAETKASIKELLSHDEDSAGHQMNPDFIRIFETDSVKTAVNKIKKNEDIIEHSSVLYIVSKTDELIGWIHIKDLLLKPMEEKISTFVKRDTVSVKIDQNIEEAAQIFRKFDLSRLPVIDDNNTLKGSLSADDVIHILVEEATEDIHKLSAVTELSKPYLKSSVFALTKSRIIWLMFLSIMLTVPEMLIHNFASGRDNIYIALAPVLPLVMATAGNAGGQASATVIRALSIGEIKTSDYVKVIFKELRVALLIAAIIAAITFGRFTIMGREHGYSVLIASALLIVIVISKRLGGLLPLLAKIIKADPATMAGPIVATMVDILSIVILFNLFIMIMPDFILE